VGGDIQGGLDGDLQRVLDETFFLHVTAELIEPGEGAKLGDRGLDLRELLDEQIGIGQRRAAGGIRR